MKKEKKKKVRSVMKVERRQFSHLAAERPSHYLAVQTLRGSKEGSPKNA